MLQVPSCWLDHLPSMGTLPWSGSMAGSSWWCQMLWHSLSLLWLCPVVTFTPHMVLPACRYSERLNLFFPSKVPSWGWSEPHDCSESGLLYLLGTVSLAAVGTHTLWSSSALAPEMCTSSWAVHWAGSSLSVVGGLWELSLGLSVRSAAQSILAGTDLPFAKRQIASQKVEVVDLKGI